MKKFDIHGLFKGKGSALLVSSAMWFALGGSGSAGAQGAETPATIAGGTVIGVEEGRKLSDSKGAFFVDTRSPLNFGKGHVPTAVLIAYREKSDKVVKFDASADQFDLAKLPSDKNTKIVFYSDGPTGWKSYKAAVLAIKAGYRNVLYMRGGYLDWTAKGYPEEK